METKRHDSVLEETVQSNKSGNLRGSRGEWDFPVTFEQVKLCKESS